MEVKMSEFTTVDAVSGEDLIPVIQNSRNVITSLNSILNYMPYRNIEGFTYTLSLSDVGYILRKGHDIDHTIYISSSVIFPPYTIINIRNTGTGTLTLTGENLSVVLNFDNDTFANVLDADTSLQIYHLGDNIWDIL